MRPLNLPNSTSLLSLEELAAQFDAERIAIVSTMPSGDLRLVRLNRSTRHVGAPSMAAIVRNYVSEAQYVDASAWAATLNLVAPAATSDAVLWGGAQPTHFMVASLTSPILAGFGGALVAVRAADRDAFTDADRTKLAEFAERLNRDPAFTPPLRLGDKSHPRHRLFIVTEAGEFIGARPTATELDPTLASQLEGFARRRVVDPTPATGGERVLLADASGQMQAFTIALHETHRALAPAGGRVLIIAQVPHFAEWLELRAEDVIADQELGRLLPAFRFMQEHFHEGITLPAIAKHVMLSPFHFHRRFTELLGITPKHFLYDCQIARAQDYLLASTHELEEVAKLCGFAHQSHFTSRFKQATGLTPTRWRRLKFSGDRAALRTPERV